MKRFTSKKQKIGEIGENISEMFLVKRGYTIIERNFTHKLGEIDIIAEKNSRLYFFEVKTIIKNKLSSVSHETYEKNNILNNNNNIGQKTPKNTRETPVKHTKYNKNFIKDKIIKLQNVSMYDFQRHGKDKNTETYNPFQNMSYSKMKKFAKVVEIYLSQRHVSHNVRWQIDGLGVVLEKDIVTGNIIGHVRHLEHVIIR